jgi:hypothetical protein
MIANCTTRRTFLKQASLGTAGLALVGGSFPLRAGDSSGAVSIVIDPDDAVALAVPTQWAISELKEALTAKRVNMRLISRITDAATSEFVIVVASGENSISRQIIKSNDVAMPSAAETFVLAPGAVAGRKVVLACANDPLGLVYAVLELADCVTYAESVMSALNVSSSSVEQPASKTRSICRSFQSKLEDKPWFNDCSFWTGYLTMLAAQRFNRFNLSFGSGYNGVPGRNAEVYLFFVYPFLVSLPEYNQVYAKNLPNAERDANLQMLKFIGDECARRGLQFQLGLWTHAYACGPGANYPIEGLTDANYAAYCRDALASILKTCTGITGVTFRVHNESGIPTGSYSFWKTVFDAFPMVGRRLEIDMHGKECHQEHIDAALATGMSAVVSPKYWAEHQGLPYHQASLRQSERSRQNDPATRNGQASRCGYANFLEEGRNFGVLHRIWPGTQRVLLWGDPVFSAGYGRAARFCDSDGIEWNEPLSFKGRCGSGVPGGRCAYLDTTLNPACDYQKFLYTYRIWGRLLFNPESNPQTWRRYLSHEFGPAAQFVEDALASASRILLLVTTYHGASVDNHNYWPEMYTNFPIVAGMPHYRDSQNPLGAASSFDPQLFLGIDEYVGHLLDGTAFDQNKYFSTEVAQWLEDMAASAASNLAAARKCISKPASPAFRRLEADVAIQSGLGFFFCHKFRSAVLWSIYQKTGDAGAKAAALDEYATARQAWADLAAAAAPIYVNNVAYGIEQHMHGHWTDRLSGIDADIEAMKKGGVVGTPIRTGPVPSAILAAQSRPTRPISACRHNPPSTFVAGQELPLVLEAGAPGTRSVKLYYRRVNQAEVWQSLPMEKRDGQFHGTIPAAYTQTKFPLQYYFGLNQGDNGSSLFPGLDSSLASQPYFVVRLLKST